MYDIVILTDHRYINPKKTNWYINQVLLEDEILLNAFKNLGIRTCKKAWDDESFDWHKTKNAIFRTTWDYFEKFDRFFSWIESTKNKTNFINESQIIKWNINKNYLKDLTKKGINIAPTIFIKKKENISLSSLFKSTKFDEAVIKPAISGAARETYRINISNYKRYEKVFNDLTQSECMIFQEFLHDIIVNGEISIILINGKYTHAVKKTAKKGDFRVQDDHGGKVEIYHANKKEISFARECIKACPCLPIYARVDIVKDNNNNLSLTELELIEPELWFRHNPESAKILAKEIQKKIIK